MTRYTSRDGLCSSSDPANVALWESICAEQASEQAKWSAKLRLLDVKAEHPDDGWVNRKENYVTFEYPRFDEGVVAGDLIALGYPWSGYRIVRCIKVERRNGIIISPYNRYYFVEIEPPHRSRLDRLRGKNKTWVIPGERR